MDTIKLVKKSRGIRAQRQQLLKTRQRNFEPIIDEAAFRNELLTAKSHENLKFLLNETVENTGAFAGGIYIKVNENALILNHGEMYNQLDLTSMELRELATQGCLVFDNLFVTDIENIGNVQVLLALKVSRTMVSHKMKREVKRLTKFMSTEFDLPTRSLILDHYTEELERKQLELERAQNYNKHLLSITTHDLSSPLNAIFGYLELMNDCMHDDPDLDKLTTYKNMIRNGANDISAMLNQLREVISLENGQEDANMIKLDLNWVVNDVCELLRSCAEQKNQTLHVQLLDESQFVNADLTKLKRILQNLLSNAIKYTPEGGEIRVRVFNSVRGIGVSVKDDGIGIPKDKQEMIFDAFARVDSHKKSKKSFGLGLYISSVFSKMMEADLSVNSDIGEGSEFVLTFAESIANSIQAKQAS